MKVLEFANRQELLTLLETSGKAEGRTPGCDNRYLATNDGRKPPVSVAMGGGFPRDRRCRSPVFGGGWRRRVQQPFRPAQPWSAIDGPPLMTD